MSGGGTSPSRVAKPGHPPQGYTSLALGTWAGSSQHGTALRTRAGCWVQSCKGPSPPRSQPARMGLCAGPPSPGSSGPGHAAAPHWAAVWPGPYVPMMPLPRLSIASCRSCSCKRGMEGDGPLCARP